MELLESDDPKKQLLKKSAKHLEAIEEEARLISLRTEKAITNGLIIGGALLATYFVVKQFSGKKKHKQKFKPQKVKVIAAQPHSNGHDHEVVAEPHAPGVAAQIGAVVAGQAATFLLTFAKEKL